MTGSTTEATGGPSGRGGNAPPSGQRPAGRLPKSVYVRRRIVALLVLVALVVGLVWAVKLVVGMVSESLATAGAPAAAAPAEEETSPAQPGACQASDIDVDLTTPAGAAAGAAVSFTLAVENSGEAACLLDAGPSSVSLTVTSGADEVWSTATCPSGPADQELLLAPGDTTDVAVDWSGRHAIPDCAGPAAGAGTYRVEATVHGKEADEAVFVIE